MVYLTLADVVALHAAILERLHAPSCPLLRPDALDSALSAPQQAAYYEGADIVRQAVILAVRISQAQAFEDGNKRVSAASFAAYLGINLHDFVGDPMDLATRLERVAECNRGPDRDAAEAELEAWVRPLVFPGNPCD